MNAGSGMGGDQPAATPTFPCSNCGHQLPVGTPICGNCGSIVGGGSGTGVPEPLAASGIRPGAVIAMATFVALAGALFFARGAISDAIDSVTGAVEDAADIGSDGDEGGGGSGEGGGSNGGSNGGGDSGPKISYRHVPQVVRDIRAGGVSCSDTRVDSSDAYLETGSCQASGSHVQINLYFTGSGIEFAKGFYDDFAFASVHADNWWLSGETSVMARIQKAIGGRLHRP